MRSAVEKLIGKARRNGRYVRDSILPGPLRSGIMARERAGREGHQTFVAVVRLQGLVSVQEDGGRTHRRVRRAANRLARLGLEGAMKLLAKGTP